MTSIAERHKYILESLAKNGFIKVNEIAKELEVTPVTIRKDLKHLEEKKLLYRTHGGASPVNPLTSDIDVHEKEKLRKEEKKRIATAAAKLIEENDSIIIASGSTVHTFAEHITPINHLTVVTASLKTSLLLNTINNIEVIQLGGIVRKNSFSVIGDYTSLFFEQITCSKLFLGVDGIDLEFGITTTDVREADLNKEMMRIAQKCIVLADSSKFRRRGFSKIANIEEVDIIITDAGIPDSIARRIEEMGIELIIAE